MANESNLKPFTSEQSREEAKKNGAKGGKKSGEARRKRKAIKEQMELLMSLPVKDTKGKEILKKLGINNKNIDNQMLMIVAQYNKAIKGDTEAFKLFQNTLEPPSVNEEGDENEIEDTSETDAMIYGENS